jgi:hypothetical protein
MMYPVLLMVVAVLGNFILRKLMGRFDRKPAVAEGMSRDPKNHATVNPEEILKAWGRVAEDPWFQFAGPLHSSITAYLRRYESVAPDQFLTVLDRNLATQPFAENDAFTQIGVWGEGSEVLVRRDASDPRIYLAEIEDTSPKHPEVLAESFEQYLAEAWLHYRDSLK